MLVPLKKLRDFFFSSENFTDVNVQILLMYNISKNCLKKEKANPENVGFRVSNKYILPTLQIYTQH